MRPRFLQLLFLLMSTWTASFGQEPELEGPLGLGPEPLKEPPARRFLDLGEHFSNQEERAEALNQRLLSFEKEEGFTVYIVAYSGIIGSDVATKANEFRDNWLDDETEGLVFVLDTDLKRTAYALTRGKKLSQEGKGESWKLPDHEVLKTIDSLSVVSTEDQTDADYLEALGDYLTTELAARLQARKKTKGGLALGYLAVFLFTVGLVFSLMRYSQNTGGEIAETKQVEFPQIDIKPRLGAQLAGGVGAEIMFSPSSPEDAS